MYTASITRHGLVMAVLAATLTAQLAIGLGAAGPRASSIRTETVTTSLPQLPEIVVTARRPPSLQLPF